MPEIHQYREFAAAGCLMSYGSSITDTYYTPAAMPVEFLRKRSRPICPCSGLFFNLKSAKALESRFLCSGVPTNKVRDFRYWLLFGHGAMSDFSPLCAPKRTSAVPSKFMDSRP